MPDSAQIVFDSGGIRAIYQPARSDFLVFSFSGIEDDDSGEAFFGAQHFARRRIAAIGIVDTGSTWFCDPRMAQAIAVIAAYGPLRTGRRRVTYGAGMGGYGALKYGRALGAHSAVAVAPQTSIDPSQVSGFDRRYQRFFEPGLHERMEITGADLCANSFVVFDPGSPEDRRHASMLSRFPEVRPIVAPFGGSATVSLATQLRLTEQLLPLAAEARPDARRFRQSIRRRRRRSAEYWFNRAEFMRRHRPPLPDRGAFFSFREAILLNAAPAAHPDTLKLLVGYADALLDAGRRAEAQPVLDYLAEVRQAGRNVPGLLALLTKSTQVQEALAVVVNVEAPAQALDPEVLLEQAKVRFLAGDLSGANEAVDAARPFAGTNVMAWRHLRWLYQRLHRDVDVVQAELVLMSLDAMPKNMGRKPKEPDPE